MQIHTDQHGRKYFDYDIVRVWVVHPEPEQDWEGTGRYLQIRAFVDGSTTGATKMGPRIPIRNSKTDEQILQIVHAMLELACAPDVTATVAKVVAE